MEDKLTKSDNEEVIESLAPDEAAAVAQEPKAETSAPKSEETPSAPPVEEPIKPDADVDANEVSLGAGSETPASEQAVYDVPESAKEATPAEPVPVMSSDEMSAQSQTDQLKTKPTLPLAIIAAIIVAIVLVGLSLGVFLSSTNDDTNVTSDKTPAQQSNQTAQDQSQEGDANNQPIDSTSLSSEIDDLTQSISAPDDTADFDSTNITDESLQLQ